jgi:hypothetical protein
MPSANPQPGRLAEVAVSNAVATDYTAATYVNVENVRSPSEDPGLERADTRSNSTSGQATHIVTWQSGRLSFEMIVDWAATGQGHVRTAARSAQIRAWRYCPLGNVSTEPRLRFLGTCTMPQTSDVGDAGKARVEVERTAGFTWDTVP